MIVLRSTRMSREGNKSCLLTKPQHPAVISGIKENIANTRQALPCNVCDNRRT